MISAFFEDSGGRGLAAVLVGLVGFASGVVVGRRRGRTAHALAVLAAALTPALLLLLARAAGMLAGLQEIRVLGPAIAPRDVASGMQVQVAETTCGALGVTLALAGAIYALARSRPDGAEPPQAS